MKKIACLMMILMLCSSACASPLSVMYYGSNETGNYAMLLTEDGVPLTPRDTYATIYTITFQPDSDSPMLYSASRATLDPGDPDNYETPYHSALMDESGQLLTDFDYMSFEHIPEENIIVFCDLEGRHGVMNEQGEILIKAGYMSIRPNGRGGYLAQKWPEDGVYDYESTYPIVYIDEKGRSFDTGFQVPPFGLGAFNEGFCPVYLKDDGSSDQCIFLDFEGTNVFGRAYGWSNGFYENYAPCLDGETNLYGLIDKTGAWVLEPRYTSMDSGMYCDSGTFLACAEDHATLLDAHTLETLASIDYRDKGVTHAWMADKYFVCANGENAFWLYDTHGELLFNTPFSPNMWYQHADGMPERLVITERDWPNQETRLVDLSGNRIGPAFRELYPAVWQGGQGRYIFADYEMTADSDGALWPDYTTYRNGLCDQDGNILLEAKYSSLEALSPNRYWARLGTRWGLIDETGKWYYAIDDFEYLMD